MEHQFLSFSVLFSTIIFVFMVLKIWNNSSKSNQSNLNLPPGPRKLPIIGNIHQLVGSQPHHRLRELAKQYGSIMHLQLGEISNVVISSPEAAKEMMKTHDINFAQRPFLLSASIIVYDSSDVAFSPYGEFWRQMRRICVIELLSAKRVQSFRSIREEEVSNLISSIHSNAGLPFNFSSNIFSLTFSIVARANFGKKCKDQEEFIPLVQEMVELGSGFSLADLFPSMKLLSLISGMRSKLQWLSKEADKVIESIIAEHKARKNITKTRDDQHDEDDLVDVLLKLQDHGNLEYPLTNDNIKAVIMDTFVAGSETSSTTTEWAMSEMLKNPRVMEKAQEEVRRVVGKKGNVDETDLPELKYLKLVIKETLRLHPAAPLLLPRECRETCEINGYKIPAKSKVIVNAWAIGRDPNYWEEPEKFFPERFLENPIDYKGNNFELIPFGAGRRMCPGILFGLANVELPLAQFLYHFEWELPDGQKLETLDMEESFGATIRRKHNLLLVPTPYHP